MKARISNDSLTAVKVLRAIYGRQTPEEQRTQQHIGSDGWGFQPHDTTRWCRIHERLQARGWLTYPHEADTLRRGMVIYAEQYMDHEDERKQQDREAYRKRREGITDEARESMWERAQRQRREREGHPLWGAAMRNPSVLEDLPEL